MPDAQNQACCARCRMDLIRFEREVKLPRFAMHAGDEWHLPQCRYTADGGIELGAGIVPAGSYTIVKVDASRACNCPHTWVRETGMRPI